MKYKKYLLLLFAFATMLMFAGQADIKAQTAFTPTINVTTTSSSVGERIVLQAGVSGNSDTSKYRYKFVWSYNDWQDWGVLRDFNKSNVVNTKVSRPGKYTFHVDVIDEQGRVVTARKEQYIDLRWKPGLDIQSTAKVGDSIKIKATAKGDGLKYKYVWSYNNWQDWGVLHQYSSYNSLSFKPIKPGNYSIYVDTMDSYGNIKTVSKPVNVILGWDGALNASASSSFVGGVITAKVNVPNPTHANSYTYKFVWSYNNWSEWGVIRDFSNQKEISYKPKKQGKYDIYVDIKDKNGNVVHKSSSFYFRTDWSAQPPIINRNGNKATITANPSKALSGASYKFVWSYNNWQEWGIIKDFSSSQSVAFNAHKPGNYTIYTDIKDGNGSINTNSSSFSIYGKKIALTFDDGPNANTISILNTLNKYGVKGTFFVLGSNANGHRDIIRRMHNDGHEIGNHSYNHKNLTSLSHGGIVSEVNSTQNVVREITGQAPRYLRPPYGAFNKKVRNAVNMKIALWSVDTLDWKHRNADHVYREVTKNIKEGDVILFHDIYPSTAKAIERIVPYLLENGYYPVTMSELLG